MKKTVDKSNEERICAECGKEIPAFTQCLEFKFTMGHQHPPILIYTHMKCDPFEAVPVEWE